jgi:UDP-N-acetyl-D-mannosaminuronate dehydrogenase
MADVELLKGKIGRREYTVGVIGLGYAGLPLVLRFGEVRFRVIGFDIDVDKVRQLNDGARYIQHVPAPRVQALLSARRGWPLHPVDPFYLTWKAREYGVATRFIELAGEVNAGMPVYVIHRLMDALNERGKALKGAPHPRAGGRLQEGYGRPTRVARARDQGRADPQGARIDYSDPHLPRLPAVRRHNIDLISVSLTEASLREYDVVLLVTDHSRFPYDLIYRSASLIVDSRNAFRARGFAGPHVVPA